MVLAPNPKILANVDATFDAAPMGPPTFSTTAKTSLIRPPPAIGCNSLTFECA
jgi:hypothetical protein